MDRKRGAFGNRLGGALWVAVLSIFAGSGMQDSFGSRELRFSRRIPLLGLFDL